MKEHAGVVAIVTGASRGLGKGIALALGDIGATVFVTGRTVNPGAGDLAGSITETAELVTRRGGRGIPIACDHADDSMVADAFAEMTAEAGRIDLLVNNASALGTKAQKLAGLTGEGFWSADLAEWDMFHGVGLRSHYVASVEAAKIMTQQRSGLIVNVSSPGAGEYFYSVAYGTAKAALDKLTADTAHELNAFGVSVVSIWPGLVRTEMNEFMASQGRLDLATAETPFLAGRAVAALVSDRDIHSRTGKAFYVADLARDYNFTDENGVRPPRPQLSALATTRQTVSDVQ